MQTLPNIFRQELDGGVFFDMVYVEGGVFEMGSEDEDAWDWEKPIHKVQVDDFYIGKFPVTQGVWKAVMDGQNPSFFKGDQRPVETVSWEGCQQFIKQLNDQSKGSRPNNYAYRLPTEAEWEYAARGGSLSKGYRYAGSDKLVEVGWYRENGDEETKPIGLLQPNELGLYDMSGNVWEWCEDDWHGDYDGAPRDGSAWINKPERGDGRVYRGGSWDDGSRYCRSTYRNYWLPEYRFNYLGLRLVLSPPVSW